MEEFYSASALVAQNGRFGIRDKSKQSRRRPTFVCCGREWREKSLKREMDCQHNMQERNGNDLNTLSLSLPLYLALKSFQQFAGQYRPRDLLKSVSDNKKRSRGLSTCDS